MTALARAPSTVSQKSQDFLPVANLDVAFEKIVIDRDPAVFDVARQVFPLVEGVGYRITKLGVGHNLGCDVIEPRLECIQDRDAMFVPIRRAPPCR